VGSVPNGKQKTKVVAPRAAAPSSVALPTSPPPGVVGVTEAQETPKAEPSLHDAIAVGDYVMIDGLTKSPEYNNAVAEVLRPANTLGRWVAKLITKEITINVKATCLTRVNGTDCVSPVLLKK
jgi:hypothetical protein